MPSTELSPYVASFIADHISSVGDLYLLITLLDAPDRWWDAAHISGDLGIPQSMARATLDRLASRNLLDIRITDEVRYRFQPGSPRLRAAAAVLVGAYRAQPAAVVRHVSKSAKQHSRDFADAFRFRRHEPR